MCFTIKWDTILGEWKLYPARGPGLRKIYLSAVSCCVRVCGVFSFLFFLKHACWTGYNYPYAYHDVVPGFFLLRRSVRLWTALSTDLVIKQVLTRTLKTREGLTRGRGINEQQQLLWLLSMPACQVLRQSGCFKSSPECDTTRLTRTRTWKKPDRSAVWWTHSLSSLLWLTGIASHLSLTSEISWQV